MGNDVIWGYLGREEITRGFGGIEKFGMGFRCFRNFESRNYDLWKIS